MDHTLALIHEEAGVFGISMPDFPGCISKANTLDDVILRGQQALALHVKGMREDGAFFPVLRTLAQFQRDANLQDEMQSAIIVALPVHIPGKAIRINITMDEHLLDALDRAAQASGHSRSGYLAEAVRARVGG